MRHLILSLIVVLAAVTLAPGQTTSSGGKFVTGYYPIWSFCSMSPSDVDFTAITHLILFTADPDTNVYPYFSPVTTPNDSSSLEWGVPNPNCSPQSRWGKPAGYSYIRWLNDSAHAHGAKTLLCLGGIYGAGRDKMAWIAKDSAKTQAWAEAAVAYITRKGMDGVDLDWEYPGGANSGYMRMLRILRRQLDKMSPPGLLTIAAPAWTNNAAYDYATIGSIVDQINIMSYDFSGGSSAWFNAGLGNNNAAWPIVGATASSSSWWNWNNHGAKQWIAKGVPANRLSMGIPFYSWKFSGPTAVTEPINGRSYGTYNEAVSKINQYGAGIYHWDDSAKAPYLTYSENGTNYFITYDDTNSVKYKAQWCNDLNLGGVMIYELWSGWVNSAPAGRKDPLLQAVKRAMGGTIIQPPPPPSAPQPSAPANGAAGQSTALTLGWNASSGASSYRVQLSASSSFATLALDQSGLTATSASATGLAAGATYFWRVNATSSSGTSAWSSVWSFSTVAAVPAVPALSSPSDGATGVATPPTLSWGSATGATSYRLQVSPVNTFLTLAHDQSGLAATSAAVSGLAAGTVYFWRVSASGPGGTSSWSAVRGFTTASAPAEPPAPPALGSPSNGAVDVASPVTLSWSAPSGASTYRVELSLSQAFDSVAVDHAGITATSLTLDSLRISAVYFWRVNAANTAGAGAWSTVNSFTTAEPSQPPPPAPGDTIPAPALLRDDFNRPDGPLPGSNRWNAVANFPNNGTLAVSSFGVQASNAMGVGNAGGVVWDSLMTGGSEASFTLRQKGGPSSSPSLSLFARLNGKDYASASGYRLDFREQTGTDLVELRRLNGSMGSTTLLSSAMFELGPGDVLTFRVLRDNATMIALVNGIEVARASDAVNSVHDWYFGASSTVFATPARFDDFRVSPNPPIYAAAGVSPASVGFGKVALGTVKRDSILVTNTGTAGIFISNVSSSLAEFSASASGATILPGGTGKVYVDFAPDGRSVYNATVTIELNGGALVQSASVSGKGVAPPRIRHASAQVNFGAIEPESEATAQLVVYNDGEVDVVVSNVLSTNAVFTISPNAATIAPADSQVFTVSARPTSAQPEDGYFIFYSNGDPGIDSVGVHADSVMFAGHGLPAAYALGQNYPNPFNPSTTIGFTLAEAASVRLEVYDALGRQVALLLADEQLGEGSHAVRFDGAGLTSGIYFYRLNAVAQGAASGMRHYAEIKKMALVK